MKKLLLIIVMFASSLGLGQSANVNGVYFAAEFGLWSMPAGLNGSYAWAGANVCQVNSGGLSFQAFTVGTPVTIVDANPAHTETVTPSVVNSGGTGCSVSFSPAPLYSHYSYQIKSGTAGLQEAINWALRQPNFNGLVELTPQWAAQGGTTGMITAAKGSTTVSIFDFRTAQMYAYTWNGSAYIAVPIDPGAASLAGNNVFTGINTFTNQLNSSAGSLNGSIGAASPNTGAFTSITATGSILTPVLETIRFCNQYGGFTAASIQACITDTPAGGTAFLPAGSYDCSANLPITITKSINLSGAGWGSILSIGSGVGATTDIFVIQPPLDTVLHGGKVGNFAILPVSGKPARHAFHLDGTNGEILNWVFDHVRVEQLGGNSVYAEGMGYDTFHSPQGTPVLTTFQNSLFRGGLAFTNSGDTNRIINNQITGDGKSIDYNSLLPVTGFEVLGNNITSDGGMHLGTNVVMPVIEFNEFETFNTFTGSNGAVIDFDGAASPKIQQGNIKDNHISVVGGVTADGIRLNYAQGVIVEGNNFGLGAGASHDVTATANSAVNLISQNNFGSFVYATIFNDSGVGNIFWNFNNASGSGMVLANNKPIQAFDEAGTVRDIVRDINGAVTLYGYHGRTAMSSADPATYLYDGTASNNITAAFSSSASTQPVSSTFATVANFVARNAILPSSAGGIPIGSAALPFSSFYLGNAATNNIQLTGTATSAKVATLPDNTGTIAELNLAQSWTAAQTTNSQIISTLATGTAPFAITSTTPVANLTAVPTTYNAAGTQQLGVHLVYGHCTLGTSCSITLSGSAVFTSSTSYECAATDETTAAAVKFLPSSGSAFALTGTGTDVLSYHCVGN